MQVYKYVIKEVLENGALIRDQLWKAHRYHNLLIEISRKRWDATHVAGVTEEAKQAAYKTANEEVKAIRATCGVYWGTYMLKEEAVQVAERTGMKPNYKKWDFSGAVAVQLQGGMPVETLFSEKGRLVKLGSPFASRAGGQERLRKLHFRVSSEDRKPVWAVCTVVYHRDLPAGAKIKWARIHSKRVGTQIKYDVQFVVDSTRSRPACVKEAIGIDLGWRKLPQGGLRVAVSADSDGVIEQLVLPQNLLDRLKKVEDLGASRRKSFNAAVAQLASARESLSFPDWLAEETKHVHAWKAEGKLARLVLLWRTSHSEEWPEGKALYDQLEVWRKQDKRRLQEEANLWLNVRNSRNQIYQDFALRAATYKTVVVEQINLRQLARHPEEGEEQKPYAVQNASGRRQFAALSELLGRLARLTKESGSTLLDQPAPWTTRTCSKCGHKNETADLAQIYFTCESCKEEHDQDVNAARNMLASIGVSAVASNRQRGASDAAGERRAKGLATRRAGKSTIKTVVEPS